VVRLSRPETKGLLEGGVFWNQLLRPKKVPLPQILWVELKPSKLLFPFFIQQQGQPAENSMSWAARASEGVTPSSAEALNLVISNPRAFVTSFTQEKPLAMAAAYS
jgi:hypothetical protein